VAYDQKDNKQDSVYSKRIRAGKRRTYFFDVRETRGSDYYLTITESRKRFDSDGYDRHKIFLYKEDFNKFIKALGEAVDFVKTDLMPDFDFDAFNHEYAEGEEGEYVAETAPRTVAAPIIESPSVEASTTTPIVASTSEEVDKW
jgi:Protein of unknown function (DUF3276)